VILYQLIIHIYSFLMQIVALFNNKAKLFVVGRRGWREEIHNIDLQGCIWIHAASLGEFEQGRPIIEMLKKQTPSKKILLTFFSPSGYEVRKDYKGADYVMYLPVDTLSNAKFFIKHFKPSIAVFIKYEFWPNYLTQLRRNGIKTIVVSSIFRESQVFFKTYGWWYRNFLKHLDFLFVQDNNSKNLLNSIGVDNVSVVGDTRFDRVLEISKGDNNLEFMNRFKGDSKLMVLGSTWPEDDRVVIDSINSNTDLKFLIAPHNVDNGYVASVKKQISRNVVLYSEKDDNYLNDFEVLILDTVGILTSVYSYADIAYVGGGFGNAGLHNILEPLIFNTPVVIGPNFEKFREAKNLSDIGGIVVVNNSEEFDTALIKFKEEAYSDLLRIASSYVNSELGASEVICKYISESN
jgi:3-deoxy-D-manno-octulosonic-acid transferase